MVDPLAISVETPMIDNRCSLEKEFIELICMNPWIVLCQIVNHIDSCQGYVRGHLTWDTKDILWIDDCVLTITY